MVEVSGPTDYAPISLDKAVENHVRLNGGNPDKVRKDFEKQIRMKQNGAKCEVCDAPIWAFGGCGMCFSCTVGEADASDDYELDEVCW